MNEGNVRNIQNTSFCPFDGLYILKFCFFCALRSISVHVACIWAKYDYDDDDMYFV